MKKLIYLLMLLVSLVLITSCSIGTPAPDPIPDEVKEVLENGPQTETNNESGADKEENKKENLIDKILDKTFNAKGSTIYIDSDSIISFTISKDELGQYKLTGDNGSLVFIKITDGKYYFGEKELVISEDLKTITIDGRVYGTTE